MIKNFVITILCLFIFFVFICVKFPPNNVQAQSDDYIQRQILQELEEVNENLKEIKELEGRIIDRIK